VLGVQQRGEIPHDVWETISHRGVETSFAPREALLHHGASGRAWFAIMSGTVLVTVTSNQGATLVLDKRSTGDLLGELAALEDAPRAATATAKDQVAALKLQREDLDAILRAHPDWAIMLLQQLAGQLRSMSYRYTLRSEDLRRRVSAVLLTNLEEVGEPVFRSTREELAGWVGATREATGRMLQQMQQEGVVRLGRGSVEVVRASALVA
jgi:CRP/FNR family cyclic AMP-dependent transcriptional regulator